MGAGKKPPASALEAAQRARGYVHFDMPLSKKACAALVADPLRVERHAFLPFLRHDVVRARLKRLPGGRVIKSSKVRDIRYAAHSDAAIYSYYNFILSQAYEALLVESALTDNVSAFRALAKSNVDFAKEAFDWILNGLPCVAMGFDVKDFFGSLDHRLLKAAWSEVLGHERLPADHFAVFSSVTRHASVELISARRALGLSRSSLGRIDRPCSPLEFRSIIRAGGLIETNGKNRGIPQGSPISAVLSNIYMRPFDLRLKSEVEKHGGLYRRYCDDILVVLPQSERIESNFTTLVEHELRTLKLEMQSSKTLVCHFSSAGNDKPLQYLGLVFNGRQVSLRASGIARFYQKMRKGIGQLKNSTRLDGGTPILTQRRRLLVNRYTEHVSPDDRSYFGYVKLAAGGTKSAAIRRQLRLHQSRFKSLSRN
ncbi:TPA: antiviral reverse transcriptase Drt2 [Stenotrophomonas maltophilia]